VENDSQPSEEQEFRSILSQLVLKPHMWASGLERQGGQQPDTKAPTGDRDPPEEQLRRRWEASRSTAHRQRVLAEAREELESWKPREWQSEDEARPDPLVASVVEDGEGYSVAEVAARFRMTERVVSKIRAQAGVRADDGRSIGTVALSVQERRAEVRRLREHPTPS
jgi:hypothetical protein